MEGAYLKLTHAAAPSLLDRNRVVRRMLVDDVYIEYHRLVGLMDGAYARAVFDFGAWATLDDFMRYCHGVEPPIVRRGLFT